MPTLIIQVLIMSTSSLCQLSTAVFCFKFLRSYLPTFLPHAVDFPRYIERMAYKIIILNVKRWDLMSNANQ